MCQPSSRPGKAHFVHILYNTLLDQGVIFCPECAVTRRDPVSSSRRSGGTRARASTWLRPTGCSLGSALSGCGWHRPEHPPGLWQPQPWGTGNLARNACCVRVLSCSNRVPQLGGLKQQKCCASRFSRPAAWSQRRRASGFWGPEVRNQGAARPSSRGALSGCSPGSGSSLVHCVLLHLCLCLHRSVS